MCDFQKLILFKLVKLLSTYDLDLWGQENEK